MIERKRVIYDGRNKPSAYKDLVWTVATVPDTTVGIKAQTELILDTIQENLVELGSDKSKIISVQAYISDMSSKSLMDSVWCEWFGSNPQD